MPETLGLLLIIRHSQFRNLTSQHLSPKLVQTLAMEAVCRKTSSLTLEHHPFPRLLLSLTCLSTFLSGFFSSLLNLSERKSKRFTTNFVILSCSYDLHLNYIHSRSLRMSLLDCVCQNFGQKATDSYIDHLLFQADEANV